MIGKRKPLSIGLDEADSDAVGASAAAGLVQVSGRKIESSHPRAVPGHHNGSHAVSAAEVERAERAYITQPLEGRANPGFVIEVSIVIKAETGGLLSECDRSLASLMIVEGLFRAEAVR